MSMACGEGCAGKLRLGPQLQKLPRGEWQTVGVPLKCFQAAGADMSRITEPMAFGSDSPFDLALARVQLGTNPPVTLACP
jgi:beta-glucosidase